MKQEVYFTGIRSKIIETLETANHEILVAVAWLTDTKIIETLANCANNGVSVSVIFYDDKINNKDLFKDLYYKSAEIRVSKKLMHNKFCVIDRTTVINGSYNWTYSALSNNENIQITINNQNLASSFSNEFFTLQNNCLKLDEHFKYAVDKIDNLEEKFEDYFESLKSLNKFPYFFKLVNFNPKKIHTNPKIRDGYYLISDKNDELNFHRYKYYLERDFNISQIQKITNNPLVVPKYFEKIIQLEELKDEIIPIKLNKYIVEEKIKRYSGNAGDVFSIDGSGNVIIKKLRYAEKIDNKYYKIQYHYGPTKILDSNLNEIKFKGQFSSLIPNLGIVSYEGKYKYGLTNFSSKVIIDFIYDNYKVINNQFLEFHEYPLGYTKYRDYYDAVIVEEYYRQENACYKNHQLNIETMKLDISLPINKDSNTNYFFGSDENYKFKLFYQECCSVAIDLEKFKSIKNDFSNKTFISEIAKIEYVNLLKKTYGFKLITSIEKKKQDEKACYIATLVYNDINHPKVNFLRKYRDTVLSKYIIGKYFIKMYYKYSPKLVERIKPYKIIHRMIKIVIDTLIKILIK